MILLCPECDQVIEAWRKDGDFRCRHKGATKISRADYIGLVLAGYKTLLLKLIDTGE